MRWVSLVIWFVLAAALGLGIMHVDTVTSASPTATAYPVPTNTFTPVPRATPDWVAKNFLYLPLVESRAPGVPGPLSLSVGPEASSGFRLRWTAAVDAATYTLQEWRSDDMSDSRDVARLAPGQPLEVAIVARGPGVYYYRTTAMNRFGATASNTLAVEVPVTPTLAVEEAKGGYAVVWNAVAGATNYRLLEATSPSMTGAVQVWQGATLPPTGVIFGARIRGTYYYSLVATTSQVAVVSATLAVPVPRPGLWGVVTYNGQPAPGAMIDLWRCTLEADRCVAKAKLDTVMTADDGSYSFTQVAATDARTALYVVFDNPRDIRDYLNFWRAPNVVGYNGRDTVQAGRFDIANVFLQEPAPSARVVNPARFRWTPRASRVDSYCVMFLDANREPLVPCVPLSYTDVGVMDVDGVLSYNVPYNWNGWVEVPGQGYGESFYYRSVTFLRGTGKENRDAVRLGLDGASSATGRMLERAAGPPTLEP